VDNDKIATELQEQVRNKKPPRNPTVYVLLALVILIFVGAVTYVPKDVPNVPAPTPSSSPSLTVLPIVRLDESAGFSDGRAERIRGLEHGDIVGYLTVPKLQLSHYPIRYGIGLDILAQGPALYPGSAAPGEGNFSMAGHRITPVGPFRTCSTGQWGTFDCHGPFRYVDTLNPGDVARVQYKGQTYTYHFVRTIIVDPSNISILRDGKADMTFTACHPPGYATQRIVAQWKLVS